MTKGVDNHIIMQCSYSISSWQLILKEGIHLEMVDALSSQRWNPDVTGEEQAVCGQLASAMLSSVRGQGWWTVSCVLGVQLIQDSEQESAYCGLANLLEGRYHWMFHILLASRRSLGMKVKLSWKPSLRIGETHWRVVATGSPTHTWGQKAQEEWRNVPSVISCCFSTAFYLQNRTWHQLAIEKCSQSPEEGREEWVWSWETINQ